MEFPIQGYLFKKEQVKIPGGYILKKWNIHGFWFLTMKFQRGVTEFCRYKCCNCVFVFIITVTVNVCFRILVQLIL